MIEDQASSRTKKILSPTVSVSPGTIVFSLGNCNGLLVGHPEGLMERFSSLVSFWSILHTTSGETFLKYGSCYATYLLKSPWQFPGVLRLKSKHGF